MTHNNTKIGLKVPTEMITNKVIYNRNCPRTCWVLFIYVTEVTKSHIYDSDYTKNLWTHLRDSQSSPTSPKFLVPSSGHQ